MYDLFRKTHCQDHGWQQETAHKYISEPPPLPPPSPIVRVAHSHYLSIRIHSSRAQHTQTFPCIRAVSSLVCHFLPSIRRGCVNAVVLAFCCAAIATQCGRHSKHTVCYVCAVCDSICCIIMRFETEICAAKWINSVPSNARSLFRRRGYALGWRETANARTRSAARPI